MNHHYTGWQRAKWLIPGCTEAEGHGHGSPGLRTKQWDPPCQHQTGNIMVFIPVGGKPGTTGPCSQDNAAKLFILGIILWPMGPEERGSGAQNFIWSVSWLCCKLLKLWGLLLSRNWEGYRTTASQKVTRNPNLLQGKTKEYAQDEQGQGHHHRPGCALTCGTQRTTWQGRPDLLLKRKENPEAPHLPSGNHRPRALGKLVRAPAALNHTSAVFFFLFLSHSCVQFSVLGVFKGTFILRPGFSSFTVTQLPPRAKECLKSLHPAKRASLQTEVTYKVKTCSNLYATSYLVVLYLPFALQDVCCLLFMEI